jgi:hypothetical protein
LIIEFIFGALHLVPQQRNARIVEEAIRWKYTTWLNIVFLILAAFLVVRFLRTGGPQMLRMMSPPQRGEHEHTANHSIHDHHGHH